MCSVTSAAPPEAAELITAEPLPQTAHVVISGFLLFLQLALD